MAIKTVDPKCAELAQHFLEGDEANVAISSSHYQERLAIEIQATIENWINYELDTFEPRQDPPGFEGGFASNH